MKKSFLMLCCIVLVIPSLTMGGVGLGIRGGLTKDSGADVNNDNMTLFGADLRITGLPMIEGVVSGEYSWKKYTFDGQPDMTLSLLSITGTAIYPIKLPTVTPYAGVGFGTHSIGIKVGDDSDSESKFGYHILAGARLGVPGSPLNFYAEYRHYWIDLGEVTGKYYTLSGGILFGAF